MRKTTFVLILFPFSLILFADDLYISMGNYSGSVLNSQVRIESKGNAGSAKYDRTMKSIIDTSNDTRISIGNIDFGSGRYGDYSKVTIEYNHPNAVSNGYFELYLDNTLNSFASIEVNQTSDGEFIKGSSCMNSNIVGVHRVYITWRNHSANLKTFIGVLQRPITSVTVVKSNSPISYRYSNAVLPYVNGMHSLKMVWRNNNAKVAAVYLDFDPFSSTNQIRDELLKVFSINGNLHICSDIRVKQIAVYTLTGILVYSKYNFLGQEIIPLNDGLYLIKAISENNEIVTKKAIKTR